MLSCFQRIRKLKSHGGKSGKTFLLNKQDYKQAQHYYEWLTMKRIITHLAIVLALLAIIGAVSASSQDSGNSTLINDTTNVDTIPGNITSNVSDAHNDTVQPNVANETNATVPINNTTSNPPNVTNGTNGTNGTNATIPLTNSINISALDVGAPGETAYQEYVEITNTGSSSINMKNWTIKDAGARHTYLFPSYVLKAKSTVTLHSGSLSLIHI